MRCACMRSTLWECPGPALPLSPSCLLVNKLGKGADGSSLLADRQPLHKAFACLGASAVRGNLPCLTEKDTQARQVK